MHGGVVQDDEGVSADYRQKAECHRCPPVEARALLHSATSGSGNESGPSVAVDSIHRYLATVLARAAQGPQLNAKLDSKRNFQFIRYSFPGLSPSLCCQIANCLATSAGAVEPALWNAARALETPNIWYTP